MSKQKDAFLITGQSKTFTCSSVGKVTESHKSAKSVNLCTFIYLLALTLLSDYKWFVNGTQVDVVFQNPTQGCLSLNPGVNESCTDLQVYQYNRVESKGNEMENCDHIGEWV